MRPMIFTSIIIAIGLMIFLFTAQYASWFEVVGGDFLNYWVGPHIAQHDAATLFDIERYTAILSEWYGKPIQKFIWSYPPHTLLLMAPLQFLPHLPALLLWTGLTFCFYALICQLGFSRQQRIMGLVLLALAPSSLINFGQIGFICSGFFLGALLLLDRRPILAGILLGLLTIKPQLGILWPFILIALGHWRVIYVATITACVLIALSIAIYGIGVWEGFIHFTMPMQWFFVNEPYVPRGYQVVMMSLPNALRVLQVHPDIALYSQWPLTAAVIASTVWAFRRCRDLEIRALVLTTGALLCTPYTLHGDTTILTAVILWRLLNPRPYDTWVSSTLYALGLLLPLLILYFNLFYVPLTPMFLIALYGWALHEAWRSSPALAVPR